jgi:hypothetical protein
MSFPSRPQTSHALLITPIFPELRVVPVGISVIGYLLPRWICRRLRIVNQLSKSVPLNKVRALPSTRASPSNSHAPKKVQGGAHSNASSLPPEGANAVRNAWVNM